MSVQLANQANIKGVYYDNHMGKWMGAMQVNGKRMREGFDKIDDAIAYRKELEKKMDVGNSKLDDATLDKLSKVPMGQPITLEQLKEVISKIGSALPKEAKDSLMSVNVVPKNMAFKNERKQIEYEAHMHKFVEKDEKGNPVFVSQFWHPAEKATVMFNENATIVIFDDGSKGVAKCGKDDVFSRKKGLKVAYNRALIAKLQKEIDSI